MSSGPTWTLLALLVCDSVGQLSTIGLGYCVDLSIQARSWLCIYEKGEGLVTMGKVRWQGRGVERTLSSLAEKPPEAEPATLGISSCQTGPWTYCYSFHSMQRGKCLIRWSRGNNISSRHRGGSLGFCAHRPLFNCLTATQAVICVVIKRVREKAQARLLFPHVSWDPWNEIYFLSSRLMNWMPRTWHSCWWV